MSEAVQVALITSVVNAAVVITCRYLSHLEHKTNERKVDEIRTNGHDAPPNPPGGTP